jgi:hypothetical protein
MARLTENGIESPQARVSLAPVDTELLVKEFSKEYLTQHIGSEEGIEELYNSISLYITDRDTFYKDCRQKDRDQAVLKERIDELEEELDQVTKELRQSASDLRIATRQLLQRIDEQSNAGYSRENTPMVDQSVRGRSAKHLDPPELDDNVNPLFES